MHSVAVLVGDGDIFPAEWHVCRLNGPRHARHKVTLENMHVSFGKRSGTLMPVQTFVRCLSMFVRGYSSHASLPLLSDMAMVLVLLAH